MSRRERFSEQDLAWEDARRDVIDSITTRCVKNGVKSAMAVVAAIRDGLEHEMPRLVAVPLAKRDLGTL